MRLRGRCGVVVADASMSPEACSGAGLGSRSTGGDASVFTAKAGNAATGEPAGVVGRAVSSTAAGTAPLTSFTTRGPAPSPNPPMVPAPVAADDPRLLSPAEALPG